MPTSDGTPKIPYGSGGHSEDFGEGSQFNLLAVGDFFQNRKVDNFWGDTKQAEYPAAKTNGTSAAVTFTEGNAQGYLDFITGTDNDGYAGQAFSGPMWTGDQGLLAEFLFQTPSSLANFKLEVGVTDAADDAGAVNSKSAATSTATDYAVFIHDSAHSSSLDLIHAKAGATVRITNTDMVLAVSTLYYVTFRVDGDNFKATIRGLTGTPSAEFSYGNATAAAGLEGGNLITPWFFVQTRVGSASKTARLYKWGAGWPAF